MLKLAFGALGKTHVSSASFNNHWGVPLTLASLPREAAYGVVEIGNEPFRRNPAAGLVRPSACGARHHHCSRASRVLRQLRSHCRRQVRIFEGIVPGGSALIPYDNPHAERLIARAKQAHVARILGFGVTPAAMRGSYPTTKAARAPTSRPTSSASRSSSASARRPAHRRERTGRAAMRRGRRRRRVERGGRAQAVLRAQGSRGALRRWRSGRDRRKLQRQSGFDGRGAGATGQGARPPHRRAGRHAGDGPRRSRPSCGPRRSARNRASRSRFSLRPANENLVGRLALGAARRLCAKLPPRLRPESFRRCARAIRCSSRAPTAAACPSSSKR